MIAAGARRPPVYVLDALEFLAEERRGEIPIFRLQVLMGSRRWGSELCMRAVRALQLRCWATFDEGIVRITDSGHAAAMTGAGIPPAAKLKRLSGNRRSKHTRMPPGLF
jgi:hypothetical protein